MIIPSVIRRRYDEVADSIKYVADHVRDVVRAMADELEYPYVGRIKTAESLSEKLESGRYAKWSSIDDLFACKIVIPTLKHETYVLDFLRSAFREVAVRGRGDSKKSPDVFRFEATRFIGKLIPPPGLPAEERIYQVPFEIQICSAFEHAWSAATHDLVYKSGDVDWRRSRMAAQLKAAVEQLDTLVLAFETSAEPITLHRWADIDDKAKIVRDFREKCSNGLIPPEMQPKDWSRFADNLHALYKSARQVMKSPIVESVDRFLEVVFTDIDALCTAGQLPISLSLLQLCTGILLENHQLKVTPNKYTAIITPEMSDIFPKSAGFSDQFDWYA